MSGDPARIGLGFIAVGATWMYSWHVFFLILLPVVGLVSLLNASIVSNVLALCVDPVEGLVDRLGRVVAVLPDDALRLVQVVLLRWPLPPVGEVPGRVERSALVVEAMSDLVPDNLDFELVYNSSKLLCYALFLICLANDN